MPVIVDKINIQKHNRYYKRNNNSNKIIITNHGNDIMKNSNFSSLQLFVINMVDKISPIIKRHPGVYSKIMKISEKLLKQSACLTKSK